MAISPQQLTIYLYSAHRAVIFAIAQLSCLHLIFVVLLPNLIRPIVCQIGHATMKRPFSGKFLPFTTPARLSKDESMYQIWSSKLKQFSRYVQSYAKNLGVPWPEPRPFGEKLFMHPVGISYAKLRSKFEVSSWNSFEDIWGRLRKKIGVMWSKSCPFWGKLFEH